MRTGRLLNTQLADKGRRFTEFSRRRCGALLGILLVALTGFTTAHASGAAVTLSIKNDDARSLRCAINFAHWVTTDFGPIESGRAATVAMMRGPRPGELYIARFDGRPMMIENIICGAEENWSDSFDQLPLMPVRGTNASAYQMECRAAPRVVCAPSHELLHEHP
jgi:hypothetical protein